MRAQIGDRVELAVRRSVTEVARPAAEGMVYVLDDPLDRQEQPGSVCHLMDLVPDVLQRLARGPPGEELYVPVRGSLGVYRSVFEADEVESPAAGL